MEEVASPPIAEAAAPSSESGAVSLTDVRRAVERLQAAGAKVTTRSVHTEVGRGSRTTICVHLSAIQKSEKAATPAVQPSISPRVQQELSAEIDRNVQERTAQISASMADLEASLLLVVEESEAFRKAASARDLRIAALERELAEQSAVSEERRTHSESLAEQVTALLRQAERDKQEIVAGTQATRSCEERVAKLEALELRTSGDLSRAQGEVRELREQLYAKVLEVTALTARLEVVPPLNASLEKARAKAESLQAELQEATRHIASSEALREGLTERLRDMQEARSRAEGTVQQLLGKVLQEGGGSGTT